MVGLNGHECVEVVGLYSVTVWQLNIAFFTGDGWRQAKYIAGQQAIEWIGHMPDMQQYTVKLNQYGLGMAARFSNIFACEFDQWVSLSTATILIARHL